MSDNIGLFSLCNRQAVSPESNTMILTKEQFEAGRSDAGGYNLKQLKAIGVPMPIRGWPKAGWPGRLIGSEVTDAQYRDFMELRGKNKRRENLDQLDMLNVPRKAQFTGDSNVETVKAKMDARAKVGFGKYGVTTERQDMSLLDWLRNAQMESLDQVIYLEAAIQKLERKILMDAQDIELGHSPDGATSIRRTAEDFANELFEKNGRDLA